MLRNTRHIFFLLLLATAACAPAFTQVYPVKSDRKWGLINQGGKLIATPEYDAVHRVGGDHSVVVRDGKYGLLNGAGKVLVETRYTYLKQLSEELILINQGGECEEGECSGGRWGLIHLPSGAVVEPKFDLIEEFNDKGLARANIGGDCGYKDCEGGRWAILDTLATVRLSAEYEKIKFGVAEEAYVKTAEGWGIFDLEQEKMIICPIYETLHRVLDNRIAMKAGEKWGVLTDQGDTLVPVQYDGFLDATHGCLAYRKGQLYGLIDSTGKELTTARFEKVFMADHAWIRVMNKGLWGLIDTTDREIIGPVLRSIGEIGPDFAAVQRGPLWGVINRQGDFIIQDKYEKLTVVNDSLFLVKDRKYHKWIDRNGTVRNTYLFEEMTEWENGVARVMLRKRWGLINIRGEWIAPPRFEKLQVFQLVAKGMKKGKWKYFYFDEKGNPSIVKRLVIMKAEGEDENRSRPSIMNVGWFFSPSKGKWGLRETGSRRILIQPTYDRVVIIPNSNLSAVRSEIENSNDFAWGVVDHMTGEEMVEPLFSRIFIEDLQRFGVGRVLFAGSGKYGLLRRDGELIKFEISTYIGDFVEGAARINQGGFLMWDGAARIDSLGSETEYDPIRNENITSYQYCEGGKWGYIDTTGKWLKNAEFEAALDFEKGLARIKQNGKWGVIDKNYQVIVKPQYDFIENLYAKDGKVLLTVGMDQRDYGFIDEKGEIAILPRFQEVGEFREGLVRIKKDGKWGYADLKGNVVIPASYREAGDFHEGRARIRNGRYWGYIDKEGKPVTPEKYLRAGDFKEGLAWVQDGKFFGYIGQEGRILIDAQYTQVGDFKEGLAPAKRKDGFGLIDTRGRWVLPAKYYRIMGFHDSIAVVQQKGNFGLVSPSGEFIVKPEYRQIGNFSEGLACVRDKLEFGFMDKDGEIRIPFQFANASGFFCGRAAVFLNGRWGFVDTTGTMVIQNKYPKVRDFREDRAAVRIGDKWGFLDPSGRLAVPVIYDKVGDFENGRAAVYLRDEGWGFVNPDGTVMIPCKYDAVGKYENGTVAVLLNGKWGLLNQYGALATLLKYDEIGAYSEGMAKVLVKRKIGIVDGTGNLVLPAQYDILTNMGDMIQAEVADKIGYLEPGGRWIWECAK